MKQITIKVMFIGALLLFSNILFCQQDSSRTLSPGEQVENAQQVERVASDASRQSKNALRSEKKAQKARKKADEQSVNAEKARNKSNE